MTVAKFGHFGRSIRAKGKGVLLVLLICYVLSGVMLIVAENRLAFPGSAFPKSPQARPMDTVVQRVVVRSAVGDSIDGWWVAPDGWSPDRGAVLYLHGNAENVSVCGRNLARLRDELHAGVFGFDYPGYGKSTGEPDEQSCQAAAQVCFSWLLQKGVSQDRIIVVGQSLGAAIALELVRRNPCRLLITSGAFTSFPDIAQRHYFWLPARHLVRLRFNNINVIQELKTPVLIAHGLDDHVVPVAHGEKLYSVALAPKRLLTISGHRHAFPKEPEFYEAVRAFLVELNLSADTRSEAAP